MQTSIILSSIFTQYSVNYICPKIGLFEGKFKRVYHFFNLQRHKSPLNTLYFQGFTLYKSFAKKSVGEGFFTWFFT